MDDYLYYLFIGLAFLAVVLLLEGGYMAWRSSQGAETKRLQKRLQQISAGWSEEANSALLKQRLLSNSPPLQKLLLKIPRMHSLDKLLLQSGLPLMVTQFLSYSAMCGIGAMAIAALLNWPFLVMLPCAAGGALIPYFYVSRAKRKRLNIIEQQLPETIDLMSRALKAGHAFPGALQMAATEGVEPSATEFRLVFDEINFGVPAQNALMNLAARVPINDLRYFVIAVLIQRESGGNLAELLDTISGLIRARLKLLGQIRVLSAEGRLSAWILCCLPFAVALMINIVNPGFLKPLWTDPAGHKLVATAAVMMLLGVYAMSRIIKIRV